MTDLPAPSRYTLTDNPETPHTYDITMSWIGASTEDIYALIKVLVRKEDPEIKSKY